MKLFGKTNFTRASRRAVHGLSPSLKRDIGMPEGPHDRPGRAHHTLGHLGMAGPF